MKQEKIEWISTGQIGVIRIDIPVLTFGSGTPKLAITSAIHGDEPIGLAVMSQLVNHFRKNTFKGTISLVLAANPSAQFISRRVSSQDFKDLNRVGKGNPKGYYTDRLGASLFSFLNKYDFVVNIHEFEMHTPVTAFFLGEGNKQVKKDIIEGIKAFAPEIVWKKKDTCIRDDQYKDTLDAVLANYGTPSFIVETVQLPFISDKEINIVVDGLIRLAGNLGILLHDNQNTKKIPDFFYRNEITSDMAGYWEPKQNAILVSVKKGDIIGIIKTLPDFQVEPVLSPFSGTLIQLRHRQLVGTGTSLFSVGIKTD